MEDARTAPGLDGAVNPAPDLHAPSVPARDLRHHRLLVALLAIGVLAYSLALQGSRGIWEPDEGRYTDIACQMLRSGDFVVPAFNDDVPHFSKPPLTYWATAAGIALLGWNEWGARLPNALAFAVTVFAVYALGRRFSPARPWLPALIYATLLLPYLAANIVTTDTLLTLWETLAALGFIGWWERRAGSGWRPHLFLMWAAFGLAFLTKGPPGLLPILAMLTFVALKDGWRRCAQLVCFGGVAIFATVGLGWYVYVAATHPGLMDYFLGGEVVARIASGAHHRNPQWYGALWVYAPTLLIGTLPWTLALLRHALAIGRKVFSRQWWGSKLEHEPSTVFLVLWVAAPLAVFALSRSRLPLYVLPLFVPLALVIARLRGDRPVSRRNAVALACWAVVLVALRLATAQHVTPRDSRSVAREIAVLAPVASREILFVDSEPVWGIALYLKDVEVEVVATGDTAESGARSEKRVSETLAAEFAEHERGLLALVDRPNLTRVEQQLATSGRSQRELGIVRDWVALAVE